MSKSILRKVLIVWAMLLVLQFLLAAGVMYQNLTNGIGFIESAMTIYPALFVFSLALFLITWLQYRFKK